MTEPPLLGPPGVDATPPGDDAAPTDAAADTVDLVALSSRLRFAVARLARLLRHQDRGTLGATAGAALASIGRTGSPTLGELAALEHVAPPTMTKVVAKLEDGGLVVRESDPADRRVSRVVLTDAGRAQIEENRSRRTAWLVGQIGELDPDDLAKLDAAAAVLERLSNPTRVER